MSGMLAVLRWRVVATRQLWSVRRRQMLLNSLVLAGLAWFTVAFFIVMWWRFSSAWTVAAIASVVALCFGIFTASWWGSSAALNQLRSSTGSGEVLTDRLRLRAPRSSDRQAYAASLDPTMMAANGWPEKLRRRAIAAVKHADRLPARHLTVIADRRTDEALGWITHTITGAASCEMGWTIASHARGRGYGTEAVRAAVAAANRKGLRHVTMGTGVDNEPARRLIERVGGLVTRTGPHTLPNGATIESVWYSLDAPTEPDAEAAALREAAPAAAS